MMLIIGGMKYITAAGNMATVTDAKDIIWNAILGLLLALLSWVIVSTINPDVLYIKHPASSIIGNEFENNLGVCGVYDGTVVAPAPQCICKENSVSFPTATSKEDCEDQCLNADACGTTEGSPCILSGSSSIPIENANGDLSCSCFDDDKNVVLSAAAIAASAECNEVCSDPALVDNGEYHGINFVLRIGENPDSIRTIPESLLSLGFSVIKDKPMIYDFSQTKDCKYGIVDIAIDFNNTFGLHVADKWCCKILNPDCNLLSWGQICDTAGPDRLCEAYTEIPEELPLAPMFIHTYT